MRVQGQLHGIGTREDIGRTQRLEDAVKRRPGGLRFRDVVADLLSDFLSLGEIELVDGSFEPGQIAIDDRMLLRHAATPLVRQRSTASTISAHSCSSVASRCRPFTVSR